MRVDAFIYSEVNIQIINKIRVNHLWIATVFQGQLLHVGAHLVGRFVVVASGNHVNLKRYLRTDFFDDILLINLICLLRSVGAVASSHAKQPVFL